MPGRRLSELEDLNAAAATDARANVQALSRRRRGAFYAVIYGLAGFICGAVFWHFIGFWSTFHDILVRGPAREPDVPHLVAQTGPSCTALVLDRDRGVTRAEPCPPSNIELAEATNYRRDRMPVSAVAARPPVANTNWTVTIKDKPTLDASAFDIVPGAGFARPADIAPN